MNVLSDFLIRVREQFPEEIENEELNALLLTIRNQEKEIEELNREVELMRNNIVKDTTGDFVPNIEEAEQVVEAESKPKKAPAKKSTAKKTATKKSTSSKTAAKKKEDEEIAIYTWISQFVTQQHHTWHQGKLQ